MTLGARNKRALFLFPIPINSNEEESLYKGESRLQPQTKEKELWLLQIKQYKILDIEQL